MGWAVVGVGEYEVCGLWVANYATTGFLLKVGEEGFAHSDGCGVRIEFG